jgi:hypothetical protein
LVNPNWIQPLVADTVSPSIGYEEQGLDHWRSLGSTLPPDSRCNYQQGGRADAASCQDTPTLHPPNTAQKSVPQAGHFTTLLGRFWASMISRPRPPHTEALRTALEAPSATARRPRLPCRYPYPRNARVGPLKNARPPNHCPTPLLKPSKRALRACLRPLGNKYAPQRQVGRRPPSGAALGTLATAPVWTPVSGLICDDKSSPTYAEFFWAHHGYQPFASRRF